MAALHFLRIRVGTWKMLAKALGFELSTMKNIDKGVNPASVNLAFQVSRLACVPFDDVVSGRYPLDGACPHCGRGPEVGVEP
jgi:DNA-binding XRE family transcriptional regulator